MLNFAEIKARIDKIHVLVQDAPTLKSPVGELTAKEILVIVSAGYQAVIHELLGLWQDNLHALGATDSETETEARASAAQTQGRVQ